MLHWVLITLWIGSGHWLESTPNALSNCRPAGLSRLGKSASPELLPVIFKHEELANRPWSHYLALSAVVKTCLNLNFVLLVQYSGGAPTFMILSLV